MLKSTFIIIRSFFAPSAIESIENFRFKSSFLVFPWHLDLNFHMNNATYFHFANKARLEFLAKSGLIAFLIKNKCNPIIIHNGFDYYRSLTLLQRFDIETEITEFDDQTITLEHKFSQKNQTIGLARTKAKIIFYSKKRKTVKQLIDQFHQRGR